MEGDMRISSPCWTRYIVAVALMLTAQCVNARAGLNGEGHPNYLCNDGNCNPVTATATYDELLTAQQETESETYVGALFGSGARQSGISGGGGGGGGGKFKPNNKGTTTNKKDDKNGCQNHQGDPVVVNTGQKVATYPFFALPGEMGLKYALYYNPDSASSGWTPNAWRDSLDYV